MKDKVLFITGGTSGIGAGIVRRFIKAEAKVFFLGTNKDKAQALLDNLKSNSLTFYQADISNREEVDSAIQECLSHFGKIDILINNAGITKDTLLLRMSDEDIERVLAVNLKGAFYTSRTVLKSMMKQKMGKIINISSVVGLVGQAGQTNYAASKAGLIGFTKALAKEVAPRNIQVNCIAPGFIETSMTDFLQGEKREQIVEKIPLKRIGSPEDIAEAALFLAGNGANYITGQTLVIDGGLAIQ